MERLFSPCTRCRDISEGQGRLEDYRFPYSSNSLELWRELNLDVSTEEFLSAERGFTYADLYAMLGDEDSVLWLTPHAAVVRKYDRSHIVSDFIKDEDEKDYRFSFNVNGTEIFAVAPFSVALSEIVDIVRRLLAANARDVYQLTLRSVGREDTDIFNAPTLADLMEQSESLKVLKLQNLESLDEDHLRVLGTLSRPGLEIELVRCKLRSAGKIALVDVLGRNKGPTKLEDCFIDHSVLADGLRGNNRLKSLRPRISSDLEAGSRESFVIAEVLRENKGLVDFDLRYDYDVGVKDEAWNALCNSLKTHPTLQVLSFRSIAPCLVPPLTSAVINSRIQILVDMLKVNTSIHTIHLDYHYAEQRLFRRSVIPYLVTNRLRPRLLAIQNTRLIAYRAKVLGRALLAVRTDVHSFWMLLSGNAEVAFPSTAATATVGASANAKAAPIVASTGATTDAPNVAAPVAGEKRKACP
jgi:hypothetical protein